MARHTWKINLNGDKHIVQLVHGYWSGRCEIWVDGGLIEEGQKLVDGGSQHFFSIDGHSCELGIVPNGLTFGYYLTVDHLPVESVQEAETGKLPKRRSRQHLAEIAYWQDLAKMTGLEYVKYPQVQGWGRHRLLGKIKGCLVVVQFGWLADTPQTVVNVLVRFAPSLDPETVKAQIENNPVVKHLRGKLKARKSAFGVQEQYAWIALRYRPKKETASQMAAKIVEFVDIVTKYVRSLPDGTCEGCGSKAQPIHLAFVNGLPWFMCTSCIAEIPTRGEEARQTYEAAPSGLLKGVLAGFAGVVLGALLWAAIMIFLERVGAIFAACTLVVVVKMMDWVGTKRTVWSVLIAAGLAMLSVVFGTYFAMLWHVLRESVASVSVDRLIEIGKLMFENSKSLRISLFISLFGVVPYLWITWIRQKRYLSRIFQPEVEVLKMVGSA